MGDHSQIYVICAKYLLYISEDVIDIMTIITITCKPEHFML